MNKQIDQGFRHERRKDRMPRGMDDDRNYSPLSVRPGRLYNSCSDPGQLARGRVDFIGVILGEAAEEFILKERRGP